MTKKQIAASVTASAARVKKAKRRLSTVETVSSERNVPGAL